ncbi:MAG: TonB-dependent hemoglobin/transferrin/lactoferrin family receptor [Burkholderiaceae bacterium]|nr:TonB-dependent hemoglobin/transferrin/lactoferrin family receptor [Burkholderiaceae bacterium]
MRIDIKKNQRSITTRTMPASKFAATFALAVSASTALAQSASDVQDRTSSQVFEAITIMGEQEQESTPWASQTNRQVLDQQQILNFNELGARALPGVNFSTVSNSINIRGLDQNRVVTRVDGIRQPYLRADLRGTQGNNASGGVNGIDFNSLNSIDIVRGANSSTIGSGAFGGVVDLRTLTPNDLLTDGKTLGFAGKTGYYSADNSWLINAAVAGQAENGLQWLIQAGGQFGNQTSNMGTVGGYGPTRTEPNPDSYTQQNYLLKLQKTVDRTHTFGLSATYFDRQDDIDNYSSSYLNAFSGRPTYAPDQSTVTEQTKRQSVSLDYGWAAPQSGAWLDTFSAQVYWQQVEIDSQSNRYRYPAVSSRNPTGVPYGAYNRGSDMKQNSYGLNTEASKKIEGTVSQRLSVGFEYLNTQLTQYNSSYDNCPSYGPGAPGSCASLHGSQSDVPSTDGNQVGLWLQNTVGFANNRFELTPGIRYDYYSYSPSSYNGNTGVDNFDPTNNSASAWSPKLLGTFNATNHLALYAQYALSFNAPTATQLYGLFQGYGGPTPYLVKGNPNLKPEKGRGWELGAKYDDGKVAGALTYFDNSYENFINEVSVSEAGFLFVETFENLEDVRIYGIEANGSWKITSNWRTFASMAWTVGKDQSTNQNLNSVAPLQALIGVGYDAQEWGAQVQLAAAQQRNNVSNADTNFVAPGYGVVDLTAYWSPSAVKGLTVRAGVFNLFDKAYWNALDVPDNTPASQVDLYTQPGRNFSLTLTYQY